MLPTLVGLYNFNTCGMGCSKPVTPPTPKLRHWLCSTLCVVHWTSLFATRHCCSYFFRSQHLYACINNVLHTRISLPLNIHIFETHHVSCTYCSVYGFMLAVYCSWFVFHACRWQTPHFFSFFVSPIFLKFSCVPCRNLVYRNFNRHLFTCIQIDWDNYLVNTIKFLTASSKIFAKFHIMVFPLVMKNFRKIENHCGTLFKLAKMDVCWCYCWKKNRVIAEWGKKLNWIDCTQHTQNNVFICYFDLEFWRLELEAQHFTTPNV